MVIEITTFALAGDADDARFLRADERMRTGFLYKQPGLVRATTARGRGNEWVVVVLWATPQDADAAAARAEQDPARGELMALVEGSSVVRKRYTTFD